MGAGDITPRGFGEISEGTDNKRESAEAEATTGLERYIDRRKFLEGAGILGAAAGLDAAISHANKGAKVITRVPSGPLRQLGVALEKTKPTFSVQFRRREDFVYLVIDGYNLVRHGQSLVRKHRGKQAVLVVGFVPQHLAERAYRLPGDSPKSPGKSDASLAYPSRLAFVVPGSVHSIPLTVAGLLNWAALQPELAPAAAFSGPLFPFILPDAAKHGPGGSTGPVAIPHRKAPKLRAPKATETALELPWRLAISPVPGAAWSHATTPIAANGWTELWHTRLAANAGLTAADGGAIRAVWNFDTNRHGRPTLHSHKAPKDDKNHPNPFRTSLNARDRYQIVRATSDFTISGRADVQAQRLWLSARGGFLESDGVWEGLPNKTFDLEEWKHLATLGRDHYVKVVTKGFLFPFGHRVVQVKVTERHFEQVGSQVVATSRQVIYLVVKQTVKSYDPAQTFGVANDSRDLPFRSIELKTLRTPDLDSSPPFAIGSAFVPVVAKELFQWHMVGTDWVGQEVAFTAPAVFVESIDGMQAGTAAAVRAHYNGLSAADPIRVGRFHSDQVAFAPSLTAGDTSLAVKTITFGAGGGTGGSDNQFFSHEQPQTYPSLAEAQVRLTAAEQASGGVPLPKQPVVAYDPTYVTYGFNDPHNKGNVYLDILLSSQPTMDFGGGSAGGVITPNVVLSGLSRSLGPVGGTISDILGGTFDPASFFAGSDARILGGVKLVDLIVAAVFAGDNPDDHVMKITYSAAGGKLTTHLRWTPDIKDNPIISKDPSAGNFKFELDGTIVTDLFNPQNSVTKITGNLRGFLVTLMENNGPAEFIGISFKSLTFNSETGQKSDVKVNIKDVGFLGVLKFIEELSKFMDFGGDGGPKIQVKGDGISADLAVKLPPIGVGVFSLRNVSIHAGFNLPFDGTPARFRFSFSTRENPFVLSVAIFGGGGFFGIAIGTDGVEKIEASFEFGAMASIDLGVASGSVELVAGVYFSYGQNDKGVTTCVLTGFVKLDGHLSILGIVTLSLEFDLTLTYQDPPSEVTGTATLTVGVSVLFFSFSVSVTATKTFGGNGSQSTDRAHLRGRAELVTPGQPPTFVDQVTSQAVWNAYCDAFATN